MNISNAMEVCSQLKLIRFPMWFWIAEILLFVKLKFQLILEGTQTLMLNFLLESSRRSSTSFFLFSSSMKMTHWTYLDLVSSPMFRLNLSEGKLSFVSTRNCSKVVKLSFLQRSDVSSSNLYRNSPWSNPASGFIFVCWRISEIKVRDGPFNIVWGLTLNGVILVPPGDEGPALFLSLSPTEEIVFGVHAVRLSQWPSVQKGPDWKYFRKEK